MAKRTRDDAVPSVRAARLVIHTDGSCIPNPGPGGWAVLMRFVDAAGVLAREELHSGGERAQTTNQRMEMEAALQALRRVPADGTADALPTALWSDSQYVCNGARLWMANWAKNGWRTSDGKPVKNQDLWRAIRDELATKKRIQLCWVRGHNGDVHNERVDKQAEREARLASQPASAPTSTTRTPVIDAATAALYVAALKAYRELLDDEEWESLDTGWMRAT